MFAVSAWFSPKGTSFFGVRADVQYFQRSKTILVTPIVKDEYAKLEFSITATQHSANHTWKSTGKIKSFLPEGFLLSC